MRNEEIVLCFEEIVLSFKELYEDFIELLPNIEEDIKLYDIKLYDEKYNMGILIKDEKIVIMMGFRTYNMGIMTLDNLYKTLEIAVREQKLRQGI